MHSQMIIYRIQIEQLQQNLDAVFRPQVAVQPMERLTLAAEMQAALTYQLLSQWRDLARETTPR